MKKENKRKQFHILLAVCMAAIIVLLDVLFFVLPDRTMSETENRNLQLFPTLNWNTITQGRFESQFDNYVADQFPMRDTWIGVETTIQRLAGNTESHDIFLGSDGYMIQAFKEPSKEGYKAILDKFTEVAEGHGELNIYALVAPTAVTVLDYRLPANAKGKVAGDEKGFIANLYADLQAAGITTIDVEPILRTLDNAGTQVYYRTDHHWTTDAAFESYKLFAKIAELTVTNSTEAGADNNTESQTSAADETAANMDISNILVTKDSATASFNGVTYDRLMATDSFQGTLTASSGFRTNESDSIYVYIPQGSGNTRPAGVGNVSGDVQESNGSQDGQITLDGQNDQPIQENQESQVPTVGDYTVTNVDTGTKTATMYDLSFLETRDKYAMFLGGNHGELKIQTAAAGDRNILVIKDSYANCFIPFLAADFKNIIVVDPRYYLGDIDQLISDEGITDILFLQNAETL